MLANFTIDQDGLHFGRLHLIKQKENIILNKN